MLSNHVPELNRLLADLGIASFFERIFNSAVTGIEKPNPAAFLSVKAAYPELVDFVMIGDSLRADVSGARSGRNTCCTGARYGRRSETRMYFTSRGSRYNRVIRAFSAARFSPNFSTLRDLGQAREDESRPPEGSLCHFAGGVVR